MGISHNTNKSRCLFCFCCRGDRKRPSWGDLLFPREFWGIVRGRWMSGPLLGAGTGACLLSGIGKPRFFFFFFFVVVVGGLPRRRASRPAVWSLVLLLGESTLLIRQPCAGMVGADPSPLVAVVGRLLASLDTRPVIGDGQLFAQVFFSRLWRKVVFPGKRAACHGRRTVGECALSFCLFLCLLFSPFSLFFNTLVGYGGGFWGTAEVRFVHIVHNVYTVHDGWFWRLFVRSCVYLCYCLRCVLAGVVGMLWVVVVVF